MSGDVSTRPNTVVGVFGQRDHLENALEQFRAAGFREEQIAVAMRGLRQGEGEDPGRPGEVRSAMQSILTVKVDGRHDEAETILRQNGAEKVRWTFSLTPSIAGSIEEILEDET